VKTSDLVELEFGLLTKTASKAKHAQLLAELLAHPAHVAQCELLAIWFLGDDESEYAEAANWARSQRRI
jgi:hypothetical protein